MPDHKILQEIYSSRDTGLFETLANSLPALVWVADRTKGCVWFNQYWLAFTGRTLEQELINGWAEGVHPDDLQRCLAIYHTHFDRQQPFEMEYRLRHHSGAYRWILDKGAPRYNEDGEFVGFTGACVDISERKQIEEEHARTLERYNLAIHGTTDGIWDWNPLTNDVYYSPRFKEMLGYGDDEFANDVQEWISRLHPEDRAATFNAVEQYLDGKLAHYHVTFRMRHKDGSWRWILSRAVAIRDEQGKACRMTGGHTDITEIKRLESKLRQSENKWRGLTEAMPQLVWMDRASDGACEYLSSQWEEYSGVPVDQLLGYAWLNLLHPDDMERTEKAWKDALAGVADYNIEYRIRRHDGVYRWFKTRGVPIRDDATGDILVWYGTCTDIQDLIEAREAAEAANRAKSEFLANMSHEIRTPMNVVVGLANLLSMSNPLTPKQREHLQTLQLAADSLLSLINDLLDIARIEAHGVELEVIPFRLDQLMQEMISILSVRAQEKGLTFTCSLHGLKGVTLLGDPTRLRQIIVNLCSNAIKFTQKGAVTVTCTGTAVHPQERCWVTIAVQDTGIGISPKTLSTLFQKFVQADSSINRQYGGSGLGLAISKTLTELMGGQIQVDSTEGLGSTFTVRLPLLLHDEGFPIQAMDADSASLADPLSVREEIMTPTTQQATAEQPCVLLVEDYAPNVMVASAYLQQFGYCVDVATNGREALDKIEQQPNRYALVLMDVQMHEMNGFDATRQIRRWEEQSGRRPLAIIGMTAHALAGDRERCLAAGMTDYIAKPFNPQELEQKMAALAWYPPSSVMAD